MHTFKEAAQGAGIMLFFLALIYCSTEEFADMAIEFTEPFFRGAWRLFLSLMDHTL